MRMVIPPRGAKVLRVLDLQPVLTAKSDKGWTRGASETNSTFVCKRGSASPWCLKLVFSCIKGDKSQINDCNPCRTLL